jgi:anti-sigma factor (TIGR02949 family)
MTDCGCDKAKQDLEEYLHHELCSEDAADIRDHLAVCPDCTGEHQVGIVLMEAVQRACRETAPETLRAEVLMRIRFLQSNH